MTKNLRLSRRTVLRGLGTAVALPMLEAMSPAVGVVLGAEKKRQTAPLRLAFVYVPNGVQMEHWTPKTEGPLQELPATLKRLDGLKDRLLVLTGLTQDNARDKGDGGGDHARAAACFLTGCHPVKTAGANIRVGVSVDQVAARTLGRFTTFPSLELGCDQGAQIGSCDSGYSCAYSANISWRGPSQPVTKEVNPQLVFDRFFGFGKKEEQAAVRAKRELYDKSVLDFVLDDAKRLQRELGATDRRKMEEYLTAVREVEQRIHRVAHVSPADYPEVAKPNGTPKKYPEHLRLMYDLLALAFRADLTRVATMMVANEGSNRAYKFIDVAEGHHDLSHHGKKKEKCAKLQKIDHFQVEQFAYFLNKLRSVKEGDGTLLDSCMIVYGSGIGDGDRHNHEDLPILLAGGGGGSLTTGRHVRYTRETPMNNLYLSMLDRIGAGVSSLGDSKGRLPKLS